MFAYIFGIADKVAKQLKNLYPEVLNDPNVNFDYSTLMYIDHMSYNSVHAASVARSEQKAIHLVAVASLPVEEAAVPSVEEEAVAVASANIYTLNNKSYPIEIIRKKIIKILISE